MASMNLAWDNSAVLASGNTIGQRAYWRLKTTGGAFNTNNFTPANDLTTAATTVEFTAATENKVYEFKIAALCNTGGPTDNNNGIIEQIVFGCITPELPAADTDSIDIEIDLSGTDITKARLTLKKQSDNSVVSVATVLNIFDSINHTFTGLDDNTGYYFEVEYYAVVNGVEVISSAANYLNDVCGGNIAGYQISTIPNAIVGDIINSATGCTGDGRILSITFDAVAVDMITGALPMTAGNSGTGSFTPGTHTLSITTDGTAGSIIATDSAGNAYCIPYAGASTYNVPGFIISDVAAWSIELVCDGCP